MDNYSIKTVVTENFTMKYLEFGKGVKPLVIIPGVSVKSVMLNAEAVVSAYGIFANDYKIYLFDRVTELKEGYTVYGMAEDTAEAMRVLGISNACVFGASQGGMIGLIIAERYPELISKLALGSSASRGNEISDKVISEWIELARVKNTEKLNGVFYEKIYSEKTYAEYKDALNFLGRTITDNDIERFYIVAKACEGFNAYDDLDKIKCKVFVIGAKNDRVLGVDAPTEIAEKLKCPIYIYDEYGHAVFDEAPDYKERLASFFNGD